MPLLLVVAYCRLVPLPMVNPGPMMPLVSVGFQATTVPAGNEKFSTPPLALVLAVLVIVRVLLFPPLAVSEIALTPGLTARLAKVWLVAVERLPLMLRLPPPRVNALAGLIRLVAVVRLEKSSRRVPALTFVPPV